MCHPLRSEPLITFDWDWAATQREAELGVSLAKNDSFALYAAGDTATALGHWDQAAERSSSRRGREKSAGAASDDLVAPDCCTPVGLAPIS